MKKLVLIVMIAAGIYGYNLINAQTIDLARSIEPTQWTGFTVMDAHGNPTKYTVMHRGDAIQIHADHQMGDGSLRMTIIEDSNWDDVIDRAYRVGPYSGDDKMHYDRRRSIGLQYYSAWNEEWEESRHHIERLLGKTIRQAIK